jgi:hypothetical protein
MHDENRDRQSEQDDRNRDDRSERESEPREDGVRAGGSEEMRGAGESDEEFDDTDDAGEESAE